MDTHVLQGHFARMGAALDVTIRDEPEVQWQRRRRVEIERATTSYVMNVVDNGRST